MDPAEEPPALETALPTADLIAEAWKRTERADYAGARILAQQAVDRQDEDLPEALAALGGAWEADDHPDTALDLYRQALRITGPDGRLADHMKFRIAEANGNLGRANAALADLRLLEKSHGWDAADRSKIDLVEAILEVQAGKAKKGRKDITRALDAAGDANKFYQAKALVTRAGSLLDDAAKLHLDGSDRKQVKNLERRAKLIAAAETDVVAAIHLAEPEWILQGMLVLGTAYEAVADDLRAAPPPKRFDADQRALFTKAVDEKAAIVYTKAENNFARGLDFAAEQQWHSKRIARLEAGAARVQQKVSAISP